jgi:hypothetical protein
MRFLSRVTTRPVRGGAMAAWPLALLIALTFGTPQAAFAQRLSPVGVLRLVPAQQTQYVFQRGKPGQARCVLFGIATGAVLGVAAAFVHTHSPLAAPDEGSRAYKFFIPAMAAGGGLLAAVGMWPGPGDC